MDFEGGPTITFLVIMLEKTGKNEVWEGFREKHEVPHCGYHVFEEEPYSSTSHLLNKNERDNFREYVSKGRSFSPNQMFITHPKIMNEWFKSLFDWLFKCEDIFGFKNLSGYETRLYAYLGERYLSYWFNKYSNPIEWQWAFVDMNEGKRTDA